MTDFEYKIPEWVCKPARVNNPDIYKIKQELHDAVLKHSKTPYEEIHPVYMILDLNTIFADCPTVVSVFEEMDVLKYATYALVCTQTYGKFCQGIHIDNLNDVRDSVGLSMPVLNCEDSYTGFYEAPVLRHKQVPKYYTEHNQARTSVRVDEDKAIEIAQSDSMRISWLNTSVPHKGMRLDQTKTRSMASFRFDIKILEELATGRLFADE